MQRNILEFFLLDTLKTTFWMENLTQRWTKLGLFFQNWGHYFRFSKRAGEASLCPPRPPHPFLVARICMWLNMHQYPWICLNILENAWINCSHYARDLNMHDHVSCSTGFWRCLGFYVSQVMNMAWLYMQGVRRVTNNAWVCLNIPQYAWTWLNIAKYPWICMKMSE